MNYKKIYQKIIINARNEEKLGIRIRVSKYIVKWSKIINSPNYTKNSIKNTNYKYVERRYKNSIYKYLEKIKLNPKWKYYELHHILPKSLFPNWIKRESNRILLTAREHFFCHQLLTKIYPSKQMTYAMWQLMNCPVRKSKGINFKFSSKYYEKIKLEFSNYMSQRSGIYSPSYGKHLSEETKKKLSESVKKYMTTPGMHEKLSQRQKQCNINHPELYKKFNKAGHSKETIEKMSNSLKGRKITSPNHNKWVSDFIWCNNGVTNKRVPKNIGIPEGFIPGKFKKGQKWYTDGIHSKMFLPNEIVPDGWRLGKTYTN